MKRVPGTQDFFQVQGHKEQLENGNYKLDTFHLQCSCSNCRRNPQDVEACHYLQDRKWKRVEVSEMEKESDIEYNKEYYQNLTIAALKEMLREKNYLFLAEKMSSFSESCRRLNSVTKRLQSVRRRKVMMMRNLKTTNVQTKGKWRGNCSPNK